MDLNVLPPDLFTARVPGAMQEQVPHVVDGPDGAMWSLAGSTLGPSGRRGKGLVDSNDPGYRPGRPLDRLADMDRDGIYCHVVYGPPLGFPIPDLEVRAACMRAYNDWAAEFNAVSPDRLVVPRAVAVALTGGGAPWSSHGAPSSVTAARSSTSW